MPGTSRKPTAKDAPAKRHPAAPKAVPGKPAFGLGLANKPMELELPSGETCLVIRPGAQGLIKAGLLDSLDQLTAMVQADQIDSKDPRKLQSSVNAIAADPQKLIEGLELVDKAVAYVVKEPRVLLPEYEDEPGPDGKRREKPRNPDAIYADDVDLEDKMFIFQFAVGGTSDLVQFRKESADLMGNIPAVQNVSVPSE